MSSSLLPYSRTRGKERESYFADLMPASFLELCVLGLCEAGHVDDFVDHWHLNEADGRPLEEALGFDDETYRHWVAGDVGKLADLIARTRAR